MYAICQSCILLAWMYTFAVVTGQDCTLAEFLTGPLNDVNFDTSGMADTYPNGHQVRVLCSIGYFGFFKLQCSNGKWSSHNRKCQRKDCGHPGDAEFAEFHLSKGDDFMFGSEVQYTCQSGYQMLSKNNFRRCMSNGWDGVLPVCQAIQCPRVRVDENVEVIGNQFSANYRNVLQFSCRSLALYGVREIQCDENGEWSDDPPKCDVVKCKPPLIENGQVTDNMEIYLENGVLGWECNPGYKPSQTLPCRCMLWNHRAEWSFMPHCEPVSCKLMLPPMEGTSYSPDDKNVFAPGDRVEVTCTETHWIFGSRQTSHIVKCNNNGDWDVTPVCNKVVCNNPRGEHVDFYSTSYYQWQNRPLGYQVGYYCRSGYKATDPRNVATCRRDGWMPKPLCQEITCNVPDTGTVHSLKRKFTNNEHVEWSCKNNRRIYITCHENGWSGLTHCEEPVEQTCDLPEGYEHIIDPTERDWRKRLGQTQRFSCKIGYRSKGSKHHATCMAEGWEPSPLCEVSDTCSKAAVENGFGVTLQNGATTHYYYTCENNYKPLTRSWWDTATCTNGEWSQNPQCIEKSKCVEPPEIPHAVLEKTKDGIYHEGHILEITCVEGYSSSLGQIICQNGKWDLKDTARTSICQPSATSCNSPTRIENAIVTLQYRKTYLAGTKATYQCRDKYTMEGGSIITCINGQWIPKNRSCIAVSCPRPVEDAAVTVTGLSDKDQPMLVDHVLMFHCDDPGKRLNSNSSLICDNDGEWSGPIPTCEDISCEAEVGLPHLTVIGLPPANQMMKIGHKLQFECDASYELHGEKEVECSSDGRWSASFPTCSKFCKVTDVPANLKIIDDTMIRPLSIISGTVLKVQCPRGTYIHGSKEVTCSENGELSDFPTCGVTPKGCGKPMDLPGGDVTGVSKFVYMHGEKVEYSCQQYYIMQGDGWRTCRNGEWTGTLKCLKPCTVQESDMSQRNIAFRHMLTTKLYSEHHDIIEFRCTRGSMVGQLAMRQKCEDGVILLPTCE